MADDAPASMAAAIPIGDKTDSGDSGSHADRHVPLQLKREPPTPSPSSSDETAGYHSPSDFTPGPSRVVTLKGARGGSRTSSEQAPTSSVAIARHPPVLNETNEEESPVVEYIDLTDDSPSRKAVENSHTHLTGPSSSKLAQDSIDNEAKACRAFDAAFADLVKRSEDTVAAQGGTWTTKMLKALQEKFTQDWVNLQFANGAPKHFTCLAHAQSQADCSTHQEYGPIKVCGRTVVSQFWGRNKISYRQVPTQYRVYWCRKCYQRKRYNAKEPKSFQKLQLVAIKYQLEKNEDWRPGTRYMVQLTTGLQERVIQFLGRAREIGDEAAAAAVDAMHKTTKKTTAHGSTTKKPPVKRMQAVGTPAEQTPVLIAYDLRRDFASEGYTKTKDDILRILALLETYLEQDKISVLPPIEFLMPVEKSSSAKDGDMVSDDDEYSADEDDDDDTYITPKHKTASKAMPQTSGTTAELKSTPGRFRAWDPSPQAPSLIYNATPIVQDKGKGKSTRQVSATSTSTSSSSGSAKRKRSVLALPEDLDTPMRAKRVMSEPARRRHRELG